MMNNIEMQKENNKIIRKRLTSAYLSTLISISLVLLLVGISSFLLVNSKRVSDYFKENINLTVLLKNNINEQGALSLRKQVLDLEFISKVDYVSKEQGKKELESILGKNFLDVFSTSPVPISLTVKVKADFVNSESLEKITKTLSEYPQVKEVDYQRSIVEVLNTNLDKLSLCFLVFIILLLFISSVLINNTIRLNVFSRRFTIHTMKLVGATRHFIRKPFIIQSVFLGLFSSFVSILILIGILYYIKFEFLQLFHIFQLSSLLIVIAIIIVAGIVICTLSTYFVINKLISFNKADLYY